MNKLFFAFLISFVSLQASACLVAYDPDGRPIAYHQCPADMGVPSPVVPQRVQTQVVQTQPQIAQGSQPMCSQQGLATKYINNGAQYQCVQEGTQGAQVAQQVLQQVSSVSSGGITKCEVVGGIAGGAVGSLAKHNKGVAIVLGSLIGGAVGNAYCSSSSQQQVAVVAQNQIRNCAAGSQWKRLNWEGHQQHGQFVCLPDGDVHRFPGE